MPSDESAHGSGAHNAAGPQAGGFRLLRKLGEGGMGTVFEAEQDHPRRRVALKIVRAERMTPEMRKRFEREAHVLGLLQHPGIAQIYQAGTADLFGDGELQSYFAMELVEGRSLTQYARETSLTLRQRLELFARVCDAVQHAHQKGVVHRDLKPGNILVVAEESTSMSTSSLAGATAELFHVGQPKILDFGLARIAESDLPAVTVQTEMGRLLGTVQYMSPEQVTGDSSRIDARSDVYALGVVGYELVSGELPHDFRGMPQLEALRVIQEDEVTPLSSIDRVLRGDVETILTKALEKDPARRYQTAADLAADVRRYLRDEPIVARPPSTAYQLRKFAARNKALVGGIAAVFVALVIGLIGTAMGYVEARRSEALAREKSDEARLRAVEAEHARDAATKARDDATVAREAADDAAAEARAVNEFLVQGMLEASNPNEAKGRKITLEDVLESARAHVDDSFQERPLLAARLHVTLGEIERRLGRMVEAERHLRTAMEVRREKLGPDSPETQLAQHDLSNVLRELDRGPEALELQRELVGMYRSKGALRELVSALSAFGQTAKTMGDEAGAELAYTEALEILEKLPPGERGRPHALPTLLTDRASVYSDRGRIAEARHDFERALALFREIEGAIHPDIARVMGMLATLRRDEGDPKTALAELEAVLAMQRQLFTQDHPDVAVTLALMGATAIALGDYARAESSIRESIAMSERIGGAESAVVARSRSKLGRALNALGRSKEAAAELEGALATFDKMPGDLATDKGDAFFELALARRGFGDHAAAREAANRSLEARRSLAHPDERELVQCISLNAQLHHSLKEYDQAAVLYLEARERYEEVEGPDALNVAIADANLGTFALDRGRLDEAEQHLRTAIASAARKLAPDHPTLATIRYGLARVLRRAQRNDEAIEVFRTALEAQRAKLPPGHNATLSTLVELGETLIEARRAIEAEPLVREAYDARKSATSTTPARLARAAEVLGRSLAAQERYDEAEPLLLESHKAWSTPDDAARVAQALAELYTALDDVAEAERWRAAAATR